MNKQEFLKTKGINIEAALNYTGDFDTYNEILSDFMTELDNQINDLNNSKNNNDMANYAIQVHALKSNARCLGIDTLADIAYNHEMASKQNDINFVNENYNEILNSINNLKNIYNEYQSL